MKALTENTDKKALLRFAKLISAIGIILFLASCEGDRGRPEIKPIVGFTPSKNNVYVGTEISFINNSTDADTYFWNFGDGTTSTDYEPVHAYTVEGEYTVTLEAKNEVGSSSISAVITVVEKPEPPKPQVYDEKPEGYLTTFSFDSYDHQKLVYGKHAVHNSIELYEPANTTFDNRPLVLLSPGGAWSQYNREEELKSICVRLAKKGYVVGLVRYSLLGADETPGGDIWVRSAIDQRNAIRYFKKNTAEFKIDSANIFIGGWSTGAILSVNNALMQDSEIDEIEQDGVRTALQTSMEKYASHHLYTEFSYNVAGILMMSGWINDLGIIDAGDTPMMLINHKDALLGDNKTSIWGKFEAGGVTCYGLDLMRERALAEGYIESQDLEFIQMTGPVVMSNYATVEAMSLDNFDSITSFFYNNLK